MVAAALAARFDRPEAAPPESRQRTLLLQIQAFVEQRLGDPELSPATIGPTVRCNHWGHGWKASPSGLATTTV